jgi:hypothetical protein
MRVLLFLPLLAPILHAAIPEGARVRLEFDKQQYLVGESVLAHYVIENTGEKPFTFSFGGDYRGSGRPNRFHVAVVDEAGRTLPDPLVNPPDFGGMGGNVTVERGKPGVLSLKIERFCKFEQAGRHTVRVSHDLGWVERANTGALVAEGSFTLVEPTAEQAEALVAAVSKLPESPNTMGRRAVPDRDFRSLRHSIYLKPLVALAERGDTRALAGIDGLETVDATRELLRLAGHADEPVAAEANRVLARRLPYDTNQRNVFGGEEARRERERFFKATWSDELKPSALEVATRLLVRKEPNLADAGGKILASLGGVDSGRDLTAALAKVLEPLPKPRRGAEDFLELPEPFGSFRTAAAALRKQGWRPAIQGDAGILLYFWEMADSSVPRRENWQQHLDAWFDVSRWPVREAAVRALPQPLPDEWVPKLRAALNDQDYGVVKAACEIAGASGRKELAQPLVEIVAAEQNPWLLNAADDAAGKLGAGVELTDAWIGQLANPATSDTAFRHLIDRVCEGVSEWSGRTDLTRSERLALREAWRAFLAKHRDALATGRRFALGGPELKPEMFARAATFRLADGREWPAGKPER